VVEKNLEALAPHMSVYGIDAPRAMSNTASLSKPVVATISDWLDSPIDPPDPVKLQRMQALAVM
jgi:hypothetical protein